MFFRAKRDDSRYYVLGAVTTAVIGIVIIAAIIYRRRRNLRCCEMITKDKVHVHEVPHEFMVPRREELIHKLNYNKNELNNYTVEEKDSLEDYLNELTEKLAEKESHLAISKSKVREKRCEVSNLHSIDDKVRCKYQDIMSSLKAELLGNEMECRKLQRQIQFVSKKRAEMNQEISRGNKLFCEAAVELASDLSEIQKGKILSATSSSKQPPCVCADPPVNKCSDGIRAR